jgi:hypothetical protein
MREGEVIGPGEIRKTIPLLPLAAATIGALVFLLLPLVVSWGWRISQENLEADYTFAVFWALVLAASILIWPVSPREKGVLLVLWAAKCVVALVFMLPYEDRYTLDAFGYHDVSRRMDPPFHAAGVGAGTQNVNVLAWLHNYLLPDSFHALKLSFAMLGLVGVYILYRAAGLAWGKVDVRVLLALGLFPSILFWSSTLGKEPLILFGVALYALGTVGFIRTGRGGYLVAVGLGVLTASLIRIWFAPIMMAPLALLGWRAIRGTGFRLLFLAVAGGASVIALGRLLMMFGVGSVNDLLVVVQYWSQGWAEGGSAQSIPVDLSTVRGLLVFLPLGIFTALFRPLPGEVLNPFGLLAGIENLVLLGFFARCMPRLRRSALRDPLVLWSVAFLLAWAVIYSFLSYQNLGSAARFRLPVAPILLGLPFYAARHGSRPGLRTRRPARDREAMDPGPFA